MLFYAVSAEGIYAGEGVPFFRNYSSAEYGAHNRNFDVTTDKSGIVYIANFEGLLCYDNSSWRIVYTPGYSRITCLYTDLQGAIWAGGYNFVAKITTDERRRTVLQSVLPDTVTLKVGEVEELFEEKGKLLFRTQEGKRYQIEGQFVRQVSGSGVKSLKDKTDVEVAVEGPGTVEVSQSLRLSCGWQVLASRNDGLIVLDGEGRKLYMLTEENGLCSNSVNRIAEGGNGVLWGVTDNGVFCVSLPSMFSRYSSAEGLKGEVTTMQRYNGILYIGTLQGLFQAEKETVRRIPAVRQACWQLLVSADGKLYAATSEGLFEMDGKTMRQLTHNYTQALTEDGKGKLYLAEIDGISLLSRQKGKISRTRIADIEKVMTLRYKWQSGVTAHDLSGNLYLKSEDGENFIPAGYQPVDNHQICFKDSISWHTNTEGKHLSAMDGRTNKQSAGLNERIAVLRDKTIRAIFAESDSLVWVGGDFGAIRIGITDTDDAFLHLPQVFIRAVHIGKDSLHFGGTHVQADRDASGYYLSAPEFGSRTKEIRFRFSSDALSALGKTEYQYRLEGYEDEWSSWSGIPEKTYTNLFYGSYIFKVRARDAFGRCSEVQSYPFIIQYPFYLKWYSLLLYFFLLAFTVFLCIKWRLRKLMKEKERLEDIVAARTADLRRAQADLLRQEKMATVGKLTKGLIDRILNPLNYINNFSHLSAGLASEMRKNLCASKTGMDEADFADSMDILDMLTANLEKIEQHGKNTARVLKAMEEILKDRKRTKNRTDLASLCLKSLEMLRTYYKEDIGRMAVSIQARMPETDVPVMGNEDQLGKTLMSLLNNSMYAITRKYGKQPYPAEISLAMETDGNTATICLRDNGVGIEESILEQVFDPFFTTKTTGEAAGVGLYLSREIITGHDGSITAASCKGEYTEFIIKLPIITNSII